MLWQRGRHALTIAAKAPQSSHHTRQLSFITIGNNVQLNKFLLESHKGWTSSKVHISASDAEPLELQEVIDLADAECRERWFHATLAYPDDNIGCAMLRKELLRTMYPSLQLDDLSIVVPQEGIYLLLNSLLAPADKVVVMHPIYQSLYEIPQSINCKVSFWKVESTADDRFIFNVDKLKQLMSSGDIKLLILNTPHNPTGFNFSMAEIREIIETCKQHNCYLFSDEMYRGSERVGSDRLPPIAEMYDKGISLGGMSKTLGMPGIRLGWIATADKSLSHKVRQFKDYTTICPNPLSELLALIGLRNQDFLYRRTNSIVELNINSIKVLMQQNEFVDPSTHFPSSGTVCFPKLHPKLLTHHRDSASDFCAQVLEHSGAMILSARYFGYNPDNRIRIGLARRKTRQNLSDIKTWLMVRQTNPTNK